MGVWEAISFCMYFKRILDQLVQPGMIRLSQIMESRQTCTFSFLACNLKA